MLLQNVICSSPVQSNEFSNLKFSYECAKYKDLIVGLVLTQAVKWLQKYFFVILNDMICFSLPQGHPRCRRLCFRSIFNFDIFRSNCSCLSVI